MTYLSNLSAAKQTAAKMLSGTFDSAITNDLLTAADQYFTSMGGVNNASVDALYGWVLGQYATLVPGYAATSTPAEFTSALVDNLTTGSGIATATLDSWKAYITGDAALTGLMNADRGVFVRVVYDWLMDSANTPSGDFATVRALLENRAEVAAAYSNTTNTFSTFTALQPSLDTVTAESSTVTSAISTFVSQFPMPTLTMTAAATSVTEGGSIVYTVTASGPAPSNITLSYNVSGDTNNSTVDAATAADFNSASGTFTLAAGQSTATFTLEVPNDGVSESLEGFKVTVFNGTAVVGSSTGIITDGSSGGRTFTLTTGVDTTIAGGTGDDTIVGTVNYSGGTLVTTTTYNAGDQIKGGAGIDTFNLTISGADVAVDTLTPTLSSIEKVEVYNYETEAADSLTIDLSLADANLTTVGTVASTNVNADTTFTNISKTVALTMAGKGDMTVSYATGFNTGVSDAATVTLNAVGTNATTPASLDVSSVEALTLVSSTAANFVSVANRDITSIVVSGDKNLNVDVLDTGVTSFDASAATGVVTADLDAITLSSLTSVKGGTGTTDVLQIDEAVTVTSATANTLSKVSGFETVKVVGAAVAVSLTTNASGVTNWNFDDAGTQQTLTLNSGYDQAVTVKLGDTDDVTNNANVALTVNIDSDDLLASNAIAGGTGTDTINVTAKGGTSVLSAVSGVETITILAGTAGTEGVTMNVGAADNTVASTKTLTVNASALTNSAAALSFTGTGETNGYFNVTGGAGNDSLVGGSAADTLTGGAGKDTLDGAAGNDVISGGDGDDSITAGAGNDSIDAGAGNDQIVLASNLTAADTIDGGEGNDTLQVSSIDATALANVTNVEYLALSGSSTATLSSNLSFTTIDMDTADDVAQSLTVGSGYTNALTVKIDAGDSVVNSSATGITVTGMGAAFTSSTTVTGGTTTVTGATVSDTLEITADNSTVDFTKITNVDVITVKDGTTAGSDLTFSLGSYATAMSINASALNAADERLIVNGGSATKNLSITGGAGNDSITGGAGNDSIVGGAEIDTIVGAAGNDHMDGGAGNDVFDIGNNELTYQDTVIGGEGNDTLQLNGTTAITDVAFMNTSGIEFIELTDEASQGLTLATYAAAAGITKVTGMAADDNKIDATGMTTGITIVGATSTGENDTLNGGTGNDTFVFSGLTGLEDGDSINGTTGTDTIQLDNSAGAVTAEVDLDDVTNIDQIVIKDDDGGNASTAQAIGLTFSALTATTAQTIIVNASAITDGNDALTITNSAATTTTKFDITGGAGNDALVGSNAADTLNGGTGNDTLTGNQGADSMTGGSGADTFVLNSGDSASTAADTIADFTSGTDKIQLNFGTLGATTTLDATDKGDAASNADGLSLLSSKIGQMFFNTGAKQMVVDTDGNGLVQATDLVVNLTGATAFTDSDVNTVVTSGTGANTITTGGGNDQILGIDGKDTIDGGAGNDLFVVNAALDLDADTQIVGGTGTDTLVLGATTIDLTNLIAAFDNLVGEASIEQLVVKEGGITTLDEAIDGTALKINSAAAGNVTLALGTLTDTAFTLANLSFTAFTYGSSTGIALGNDDNDKITVTLANSAATFVGSSIVDEITAQHVDNNIDGGAGNDLIDLGAGIDVNTITGGEGTDTIETTADVDLSNNTITGIEKYSLATTGGADVTLSVAQVATLNAATGAAVTGNTADGVVEYLKVTGGNDADTINVSGITFTNAGVQITGGQGIDAITLASAGGTTDRIVFGAYATNGADTIANFQAGGTGDKLVIGGLSTDGTIAGAAVETFDGTASATDNAIVSTGHASTALDNTTAAALFEATGGTDNAKMLLANGDQAYLLHQDNAGAVDFGAQLFLINNTGGAITATLVGTLTATNGVVFGDFSAT